MAFGKQDLRQKGGGLCEELQADACCAWAIDTIRATAARPSGWAKSCKVGGLFSGNLLVSEGVMNNLAEMVLDYFWFLNFSSDDDVDLDRAVEGLEALSYRVETMFSEEEKEALKAAANQRLAWWLREPDEHGYTPRKLLTTEQKEFLEAMRAGRFSGPD